MIAVNNEDIMIIIFIFKDILKIIMIVMKC